MQFIKNRGQHGRYKNSPGAKGWRQHQISQFRWGNPEHSRIGTWWHVDTLSSLLFSMVAGFALAITLFSVRHTSHRRVPHL